MTNDRQVKGVMQEVNKPSNLVQLSSHLLKIIIGVSVLTVGVFVTVVLLNRRL